MNSDTSHINILNVQKVSEQEKDKIMKEIETKTENKVIDSFRTGKIYSPLDGLSGLKPKKEETEKAIDMLTNILQSGANEFEKKVGRPMTYAEMRAMFG